MRTSESETPVAKDWHGRGTGHDRETARATLGHAAARPAPRPGRAHGAVRRLLPAGSICRRHHRRAQSYPQRRRSVRRLAHGAAFLVGPDHAAVARALEALVPADILGLGPGRQRYTQLLNAEGGIVDDLMVTRSSDPAEDGVLMLVVNAARKEADFAHFAAELPAG